CSVCVRKREMLHDLAFCSLVLRRPRSPPLLPYTTLFRSALASLTAELGLPCQLALEEYMACGVGGCAGCAVRIETPDGPAMKRVCVDGPVFEAREVYPALFR